MVWADILSYVLVIILAILCSYLGARLSKARRIMKELSEAFDETAKAIEDNKLTLEEARKVVKEWKDVIDAFLEG